MRIAMVSPWDTEDARSWSGVIRPMREALAQRVDLEVMRIQNVPALLDRALARAHGVVGSAYLVDHGVSSARRQGASMRAAVNSSTVDAVLAVTASPMVATAGLDVPVVQVTDTTVRAITDYYPLFTGLGKLSRVQAEILEKASQRASAAVVTTSDWARRSFVEDYGMDPGCVSVAPFGPAILPADAKESSRPSRVERSLRVLLVASDWRRKGGDAAVAAVARLRQAGHDATLTVAGQCPVGLPRWVRPVGRLGAEKLSAAYASHDVLLELATANAGGVTLTDAAAHGLPVIVTDTGGVGAIVEDEVSGILVRTGADVDRAMESVTHPQVRQRLAAGSLARSRDLLNWDVWSAHVVTQLQRVTAGEPAPRQGEKTAP